MGSAPAYAPPSLTLNYGTLDAADTSGGTETALGVDDFIYDEDPEIVQKLLMEVADENPNFQKEPKPRVFFEESLSHIVKEVKSV